MMLFELFTPDRTLETGEADRLARRLVDLVGGHTTTVRAIVHQPAGWAAGRSDAGDGRQWLVRISMPDSWRRAMPDDSLIADVTTALGELEDDPDRVLREPAVWVQFVDVPEGGFGTFGTALGIDRLADLATGKLEVTADGDIQAPAAAADIVRDPICGMSVDLSRTKLTLEINGTTYGFCARGCRDTFAADRTAEASS
ncbi:YHS domain-containing protein [Nitriliruptor alkaliphilus]|uniref:YHS domain-containing protein n=1 Tax=Nitriliruptor alkaliphilus TaxID=427918 RepID=UPI000697450D|nr:YHS domain-containing protein [Nitriliruptor alkaliphilus]